MILAKADLMSLKAVLSNSNKRAYSKVDNKMHEVVFLLSLDEFSLEEGLEVYRNTTSVYGVLYEGTIEGLNGLDLDIKPSDYIVRQVLGTNDMDADSFLSHLEGVPEWMTLVFELPEDYIDLGSISTACSKSSRVRFKGDSLYAIKGVKLGIAGFDILDEMGVKLRGKDFKVRKYTMCEPLGFFGVKDLEIVLKEARAVKSSKKKSKKSSSKSKVTPLKPKKENKKSKMASILQSQGVVEL